MEKFQYSKLKSTPFLLAPILLVIAIYSASIPKDFTNWDDPQYILDNPLIRGFSAENLHRILSQPYFGNYAPVSLLSYALDANLWGLNANAFHLHNVLLHVGCVIALYVVLGQLGFGALPRHLVVLLFAVHPANVESVSWASERKNLLSALFFLLSFSQYIRYTRQRTRPPYLLSLLFFMLSILSKAGTVVTPLVFVAFDSLVGKERLKEIRWAEKAPFFVLAAAHVYLSLHAAGQGGSLHSYYDGAPWLRVLDTGRLTAQYLAFLFWPLGLTPLVTPKIIPSAFDLRVIVPFLAMVCLLVVWFRYARRSFFWVSFFLLLLAPVMNIVPLPVVMAYRYLYLPQIGVWVLVAGLIDKAWSELVQRPWHRWAISLVVVAWVVLLTVQARGWAGEWKNSLTLWHGAVERNPANLVARANLGQAYLAQGLTQKAAAEFSTVKTYQSDNVLALTGLALCFLSEGDPATAERYAAQATAVSPEYALGFRLLGRAKLLQQDLPNARAALLRAHELNPADNSTLDDLVSVHQASKNPLEAVFLAELMIRNSPNSFQGYWAQARLLIAGKRYDEAVPYLEKALALLPPAEAPGIRQRIGLTLAEVKKTRAQKTR